MPNARDLTNAAVAEYEQRDREQRGGVDATESALRIREANEAKTILGREIALRGLAVTEMAGKLGMPASRLRAVEAGTSTVVTSAEAGALTRWSFGVPIETLLAPNTPENRSKLAGRY